MMIHFTVISLQPKCRDYRAEVNYTLNMKLAISYLNTCFRMRRITKQMLKLLQEINLQVLHRPHRNPFRQTVLSIINRVNNRCINNRQYQISRQFPNINCFQTQEEINVNQNPTFTGMLNNNFS